MSKKELSIAVLAHVDAGKTTLSEALLYKTGTIRKQGRVDHRDAYLDTDSMEKDRGITIYTKQARMELGEYMLTLLDTPGHVDFSAEMERALYCLDYAILVISAADGVQGHDRTLWQLLKRYNVPVFIFVNKMDQPGMEGSRTYAELKKELTGDCVDFTALLQTADEGSGLEAEAAYEEIALSDEKLMERYLETGNISDESIAKVVAERKIFPVMFGSALKMAGVDELIQALNRFMVVKEYPKEFSARVFKISRDSSGLRLTHLKVTGGSLKVRSVIPELGEKVNQIRLYSGEKFETTDEVQAGGVCTVAGLNSTYPGMGIGENENGNYACLEPVLTYKVILPDKVSPMTAMADLKELEEEKPELHPVWNEESREIQAQVMGQVQIEILKSEIKKRYDLDIEFAEGTIIYKETIADTVVGIGHFEPLRHYAEVHLVLEPLERGSGLQFDTNCSEDVLAKNWQRLILTHLKEKVHRGVLTGAAITDIKITLVAGKAHQKHTEGGDFRQATYRAVRQGLMQANSILLEPYYRFRIELPEEYVGHAMMDIDKMCGKPDPLIMETGSAVLTGIAPVSTMQGYQKEIMAYTGGRGHISLNLAGYFDCHNPEEVLNKSWYDPALDVRNPASSVFCAHGAGFIVDWDMVGDYAHVDDGIEITPDGFDISVSDRNMAFAYPTRDNREISIGTEEIDAIINAASHANSRGKGPKNKWKRIHGASDRNLSEGSVAASKVRNFRRSEYLLVDGYNIIFAWKELSELSNVTIDGARGRLLDLMSNYQGIRKCEVIVVFDAYRLKAHPTEIYDYHNIHVVYTKEAETADQYIEKFAHENGKKYKVTVATSDGIEQIIIRGQGCLLISARELEREVLAANENIVDDFNKTKQAEDDKNYLLNEKIKKELGLND